MNKLSRPAMLEDEDGFDDLSSLEGIIMPTRIKVDGEEVELMKGGPVSEEAFDMDDNPFDYYDEYPEEDPFEHPTVIESSEEYKERITISLLDAVQDYIAVVGDSASMYALIREELGED